MISLEQVSGEIAALEEEKPTHALMQKLANLYVVRDHLVIPQQTEPVIAVSDVISTMGDSEFLQAIDGKKTKLVIDIIDELMSALQVLNPSLYSSVIRKFM